MKIRNIVFMSLNIPDRTYYFDTPCSPICTH